MRHRVPNYKSFNYLLFEEWKKLSKEEKLAALARIREAALESFESLSPIFQSEIEHRFSHLLTVSCLESKRQKPSVFENLQDRASFLLRAAQDENYTSDPRLAQFVAEYGRRLVAEIPRILLKVNEFLEKETEWLEEWAEGQLENIVLWENFKIAQFVYGNCPTLVPLSDASEDWRCPEVPEDCYRHAGFDPNDHEIGVCFLDEPWLNYPRGTVVLSEWQLPNKRFAVIQGLRADLKAKRG